jgi:hypothetical protein
MNIANDVELANRNFALMNNEEEIDDWGAFKASLPANMRERFRYCVFCRKAGLRYIGLIQLRHAAFQAISG